MNIYLDFDGTVVEHEYPKIGRYVPHSLRVIERLQKQGHKIILNTYRANCDDLTLDMAIKYIETHRENPIVLDGVADQKMQPTHWEPRSDKNALFIDDQAFAIPLLPSVAVRSHRVDWNMIEIQLEKAGILTKQEQCQD